MSPRFDRFFFLLTESLPMTLPSAVSRGAPSWPSHCKRRPARVSACNVQKVQIQKRTRKACGREQTSTRPLSGYRRNRISWSLESTEGHLRPPSLSWAPEWLARCQGPAVNWQRDMEAVGAGPSLPGGQRTGDLRALCQASQHKQDRRFSGRVNKTKPCPAGLG